MSVQMSVLYMKKKKGAHNQKKEVNSIARNQNK